MAPACQIRARACQILPGHLGVWRTLTGVAPSILSVARRGLDLMGEVVRLTPGPAPSRAASQRATSPASPPRSHPVAPTDGQRSPWNQAIVGQFDEAGLFERCDDGIEVAVEQGDEVVVRDVAGGDHQQAPGRPTVLGIGQAGDLAVGRPVGLVQLGGVGGVVAGRRQTAGQSNGKLGVDEELHAVPSGTTRRIPVARAPNSRAASRVVTLEVRVVGDHILDRHAGGQQLEEVLDRVAQPPDGRLAVADRGVGRDPVEPRHRKEAYPSPVAGSHITGSPPGGWRGRDGP